MEILTPEEAQRWIESGEAVLVDVREAGEFAGEHIKGAVSCPLSQFDVEACVDAAGGKKLIIQCLSGVRSATACQKFFNATGQRPYRMRGCLTGWKQAGLPTERG